MKILTKEEMERVKPVRSLKNGELILNLQLLKPGEGLHIESKDYSGKSGPYKVVARVTDKLGWVMETGKMSDGNGWLVKRVS